MSPSLDFESSASTNSAIPAAAGIIRELAAPGNFDRVLSSETNFSRTERIRPEICMKLSSVSASLFVAMELEALCFEQSACSEDLACGAGLNSADNRRHDVFARHRS